MRLYLSSTGLASFDKGPKRVLLAAFLPCEDGTRSQQCVPGRKVLSRALLCWPLILVFLPKNCEKQIFAF